MAKPAYDLTTEEGTNEYLRDVEIEYSFQCLSEKDVEGCHRLAEFQDIIRQNYPRAASLYKENCDKNNHPKCCYKYGQFLAIGRGVPEADLLSAQKYYEKSCELKYAKGCYYGAELQYHFAKEKKEQSDEGAAEKAISLYSKGCNLNDGNSCFTLSTFYLFGRLGLQKDLKKAFEFTKKGCELDNYNACNHLSLNYKYGHGTEQNFKLAAEAKVKAKTLTADEMTKQADIRVNE